MYFSLIMNLSRNILFFDSKYYIYIPFRNCKKIDIVIIKVFHKSSLISLLFWNVIPVNQICTSERSRHWYTLQTKLHIRNIYSKMNDKLDNFLIVSVILVLLMIKLFCRKLKLNINRIDWSPYLISCIDKLTITLSLLPIE